MFTPRRISGELSLLCVVFAAFLLEDAAAFSSSSGPHVTTDVNILLPPKMTHPVEYRLSGSDGCFTWSWDHHDILSVLPEYNSSSRCSTSAHLKSIAHYSGRKETAVYATDVNTGMVIRWKVYIDNISRIQIFHSSVKLDLDGLATLHVLAFDVKENAFSSVVGLRFMWQLGLESDDLPCHLIHVPLKDSPLSEKGGLYGDLNSRIRIEESGLFSDLYVVKGTEVGHETVTVQLQEPHHEPMADKIILTVAEAMSLDPPSPVFLLINSVVHYTLKVIRGNIPQTVTLPSPHHQWSSMNSSVAQVDERMGKAYALNLGVTTISVEDNRVSGHQQMSSLHVVIPDTLSLYLLPLSHSGDLADGVQSLSSVSRWYVVSGRQYLVHAKVFSGGPGEQEIYIAETEKIKFSDNQSEYWDIFPLSDVTSVSCDRLNSRILKATSRGQGKLTATLSYSPGHHETEEILKTEQDLAVCDQVKFNMEERSIDQTIVLPWVPAVYQELELKGTGGCAISVTDYKWVSSDMETVYVSASGVVRAKRPGKATIRVISAYDSFNFDELEVEVSIPSSMFMLPNFPVEARVGSQITAFVTLKAMSGAYFTKCDALSSSIIWTTGNESFTIVKTSSTSFVSEEQDYELSGSFAPPCAWAHLYASSPGRTVLHATFAKDYQDFGHAAGGSVDLKASCNIAAYLPFIVHQASDGNQFGGYWFDWAQAEAQNTLSNLNLLYLVPGSEIDVMLRGGPEPWDHGVEFISTAKILHYKEPHVEKPVAIHEMSIGGSDGPYTHSCKQLGMFEIIHKRGNLDGDDHPLPVVEETKMQLKCSFPSSIIVIADQAFNSPEIIGAEIMARRSSGHIRDVPVTVANGRTIRVSAVGISESGLAFGNSSSLSLKWELINCDGLAVWDTAYDTVRKSSWEGLLVLQNSPGLCIVRATVVGFSDYKKTGWYLDEYDFAKGVLTDAIPLKLVSTLRIDPEFVLLFFSPDVRLNLSITGGSGFLESVVNDTLIVDLIQPPSNLQCSQLLLAPKSLGTAQVTVHDKGISPSLAANSVVQVADLDWIKITSGEELNIMEGSSQSIDFLVGVDDGRTFESSQYVYMNIRVHIEDEIIELVDEHVKEPKFVVYASRLGVTTFYLSGRQQSGHEVVSQTIKIEVYAPPSIHPGDLFLVPGASYVLTLSGGPTIGTRVEFASMDGKTATVDKTSGLLSAVATGNTSIVATVYRGGDITICQAYGKVSVGVPSSAILNVQSDELDIGREMPIFPSLSEGTLFSFYELCDNYQWTIDREDLLSFKAPGEHDLSFIQVLQGKSSGKVDVSVSFSCRFLSHSRVYRSSVSIWVLPDFPLALGVPMTWMLPPHYTTSNLLPLSSSSFGGGDVISRKETIKYSLLKESDGKIKGAQVDAIYIDGARIMTTEANQLACIQAKDRSTGRSVVASCVKIAEVSQIRIQVPSRSVTLNVGAELDLPVTYCDNLGNPFHEAYNIIHFRSETNYRDSVTIFDDHNGNGKIHVKAMRHGKALVQVSFSSNPQKSEYVLISVGARIYPDSSVLHRGSRVNFRVDGLNDQSSGRWLSANSSVLSIDMTSGDAIAKGEGTTQVIFEGSGLKVRTRVTVLSGNVLSVDAPKEILTNAPFLANTYSFSVKLGGAYDSYECKLEPAFVGYAKPWTDPKAGESYCLFFPYSPEHLVRSLPNLKDMKQDVLISMSASLSGASHISGTTTAIFVGGFSILGMDRESKLRFDLTLESSKTVFTILGNTNVSVHSEDHDKLLILPISREDKGIGGTAQYEVRALGSERFRKKLVIITLPATGQTVEIEVNFEPGERMSGARSTTKVHTSFLVVLGCFVLLGVSVATLAWYLERPGRSHLTTSAASPLLASPVTPERTSRPMVNNELTPQTPKPFLEYLRNTVDETPNYRRVRRVNPQNTY